MKDVRISYDSLYDRKVKISFKLINLLYTGVGTFFFVFIKNDEIYNSI